MRRSTLVVVLYCTLLATFEQEVGNSKQDLVTRIEISACGNRYDTTTTIQVTEQVVTSDTGAKVGAPRRTFLELPKPEPPVNPNEPPAGGVPGN